MANILIIGGGRIGKTLKEILIKNKPIIWDIDKNNSDSKKTLEEEIKNKDLIFVCVPSIAVIEILTKIKLHLDKNAIVVCLSKGLYKNGKFTYEVLSESALEQNYGILAGPLMAEELKTSQPTIGVLGLKNNKDFLRIKEVFIGSPIRLVASSDLKGLAIGGTLKNIYSLFLGIVEELKFGDNFKAIMLTKSLREIKIIGQTLGAKLTTLNSFAGLADLVVTSYSQYSRDRQSGQDLILGRKCDCEGLNAAKMLNKRLKNKDNLPILKALLKILEETKDAKSIIESLLPN